jgi:hypothetical protein
LISCLALSIANSRFVHALKYPANIIFSAYVSIYMCCC